MIRYLFLLLPAALLLPAGCGRPASGPEPVTRPAICIVVPEPSTSIERAFSGVIDSVDGANLAFEVGGRVVEVPAKEGVRYREGEVLARLDTSEFENQLSAAQAQLTEARQNLRRTQQLFETGNASQSQLESAIAREKGASSNFISAEKRLNDATLRMPYAGIIGTVNIDEQVVIAAGQAVMTIQGEGGMEFDISVPAEMIQRIEPGMKATVSLGSIPGESFSAEVDSVSPEVSVNTTYGVTLVFAKQDERLRKGLDGEALLSLPHAGGDVIRIPVECVATLPADATFVWVVERRAGDPETGTVSRRRVEIGQLREKGTLEILSGLEPGEIVVSRGVHRLEEGQEVETRFSLP